MPGPLEGVRIADLTWLLAGAGGPKVLAAMGAEVIRCEWVGKLDFLRLGPPQVPLPGQGDVPIAGGGGRIVEHDETNGLGIAGRRGASGPIEKLIELGGRQGAGLEGPHHPTACQGPGQLHWLWGLTGE